MVPAMEQTQVPLQSCPHCAAQMPPTAAFCPGCGRSMQAQPKAEGRVGRLPESIAGGLAYVSFIPAILFLFLEPYKSNRFVRFHSFQCLFACVAAIVIGAILRLVSFVLFMIALGPLLVTLVDVVVGLAALFVWLVLLVKAVQGEWFKLPLLGDFAERYSDPM
jgi:uncharacterized membrane protein/ribosomal protein L40E